LRHAVLALCFLAAIESLGASPSPKPTHTWDPNAHYGTAYSPALGAWLPSYGVAPEAWWHGQATHIDQRDGFAYENEKPWRPDALGFQGPDDGTFFVYGEAGPPKGHVVYDPAHRIAFYDQGCCSWHDVVVAADVAPPPKRVVTRDLSDIHTVRGIRLGVTPTAVMQVYGKAKLLPVTGHADVQLLAYTTWAPMKSQAALRGPCGQLENFVFRQNRLIFIQLGNGC
jgi:hypothetical protein